MALKHINNGNCPKCDAIFDRYIGFHHGLRAWFKEFQMKNPEAHISCAGRGRADQEDCLKRKVSNAPYGKSAHNWNAAIDLFEMSGDIANIYEPRWFKEKVAPSIPAWLSWYGAPGADYPEQPHIEVDDWKFLSKTGKLSLVE